MFEQMRKPRPPGVFVLRADVVPDIHGDHRETMVFVNDHAETVLQRMLCEGDMHKGAGPLHTAGTGALL